MTHVALVVFLKQNNTGSQGRTECGAPGALAPGATKRGRKIGLVLNWLFLGLNLFKKVDCCIFLPAFGCCARAGQNTHFQKNKFTKSLKKERKCKKIYLNIKNMGLCLYTLNKRMSKNLPPEHKGGGGAGGRKFCVVPQVHFHKVWPCWFKHT